MSSLGYWCWVVFPGRHLVDKELYAMEVVPRIGERLQIDAINYEVYDMVIPAVPMAESDRAGAIRHSTLFLKDPE